MNNAKPLTQFSLQFPSMVLYCFVTALFVRNSLSSWSWKQFRRLSCALAMLDWKM